MAPKYKEYKNLNFAQIAGEILDFWKKEKVFEKSVQNREGAPSYTFYEFKILGTKRFDNVYSNTDPDGSEIYFNHEFGIVAFKDREQALWVLDRIE